MPENINLAPLRVSGRGTVSHPVTGRPMQTICIEQEGFGTIGEWLPLDGEGEDRCRLFAAAPRLYAALAALVKPCERALNGGRAFGFWKDDEALLTEARAALAAVRGEV